MIKVANILTVALRAALALAFVVVGGHEAFVVGDAPARVWGWAMIATGAMLAFGAVAPKHPWGVLAGLVGSAAAAVVAGYVMYAAVSDPDPARPATVALAALTVAVAVASGAALVASMWTDGDLRKEIFKPKPIIASVASVGTLLTAAQFLQDTPVGTGSHPVTLILSVDFERAPSPRPDLLAYDLTVHARNPTGGRVGTLGSACSVIGRRVRALPDRFDPGFDRQAATRGATEPSLRYRDRAAREAYAELLYSEPLLDSFGFYFEPGEETTNRRTVLVRPGEHDLYEAVCEVYAARGARLAQVAAGPDAETERFAWSGGVAGSTVGFGTFHVTRPPPTASPPTRPP